jgi:hypothetical protein
MPYTPADPVASGKPYVVDSVDEHAPTSLHEFVGETVITLSDNGGTRRVMGVGCHISGGAVRFHEKDALASTKDVRVWVVRQRDDSSFVAEHAAVF